MKDAQEAFLEKLIFGEEESFEDWLSEVDGGDSDDNGEGGIALVGDGDGIKMREQTYRRFKTINYSLSNRKERKIFQNGKTPMMKRSHHLTC
ncbi:hypothetical protein HOY82DRAFT_613729 [Tuber indicum]|nr:hypothetical protein HOY82DRAFT_613729 [Tuber indicum]